MPNATPEGEIWLLLYENTTCSTTQKGCGRYDTEYDLKGYQGLPLTRLRFVQTKGVSCNRLFSPLEKSGKDDMEYDTEQFVVNDCFNIFDYRWEEKQQ